MTTAQQIRLLRAWRDMTQLELSKASGIPRSVIAQLETGNITPSDYYLGKLRRALDWPKLAEQAFQILEQ